MVKSFTDLEIAARIVPASAQWPSDANTIAWDRLRECVDALRGLVYTANSHCLDAEQNQDFSAAGIIRRRTQIGQQALAELADFKPLVTAEKAVAKNLIQLEERMVELPKPTANAIEFMLEQEIRSYVSEQKSPVEFVLRSISDQRILSAVLTAPSFLSGLTTVEWNVVRERARSALHPTQTEMQQWLNRAMGEVREGASSAKRMLLERCELREEEVGRFSPIRQ